MKKSFIFLLFLLVGSSSFATIRRVNNNPGVVTNVTFVFSNTQAAITASVSGDTIYLEPSDINYGSLAFASIKLTIIGPGYLLNKNPNTPFDKRSASVSSISIAGNSNTNGSRILGLEVKNSNGAYGDISITNALSNLEISNCICNDLKVESSSQGLGCLISNNIILNNLRAVGTTGFTSSIITNNIIWGSIIEADNDNIIKNNIIYGGANFLSKYFNNIIFQNNLAGFELNQTSRIFNNVCVGCTGTPINNNFFTTTANTIFNVAEPRNLDDLRDDVFQLPSTSPAKGKGVGGIDCGVFAGATPYVLSGIPAFPMITSFSQGVVSGANLPITISIKRN
jgi:hypothetical protein